MNEVPLIQSQSGQTPQPPIGRDEVAGVPTPEFRSLELQKILARDEQSQLDRHGQARLEQQGAIADKD